MNVRFGTDGWYGNSLSKGTEGYYDSGLLGPDDVSPLVEAVTPTPATTPGDGGFPSSFADAATTPIVIDVVDLGVGVDPATVQVTIGGIDGNVSAVVDGALVGDFVSLSSITTITGGVRLSLLPVGGWTGADTLSMLTVTVTALDTALNTVTGALSYILPANPSTIVAIDHVAAAIARLPEQFRSHDEDE